MTDQWPVGGYDGSAPGGPGDDFSDLDSFGGDYKPEHAFRPGLESLADATYDFEVVSAALDKVNADRICRITLKVNGSQQVDWTHWLNRPQGVNGLCAELVALGFDAHLWNTPGRPLSREIPAAVARLPGIRFRAVKVSRKDSRPGHESKVYHDLRVSSRHDGRPMPPQARPQPDLAGPRQAANGPPTPVAAPGTADEDDIPF